MLDESQRTAVLALHKQGHSIRAIATALQVSRDVVKVVVEHGSAEVPRIVRPELCESWRDEILAQHAACKGNLVRVHEELLRQGAKLSYQALTGFCRRHGIGHSPRQPSGHYDFPPGQESG